MPTIGESDSPVGASLDQLSTLLTFLDQIAFSAAGPKEGRA
jgi:hypothetical protein